MDPFDIVADSSLIENSSNNIIRHRRDSDIYVGIVKEVFNSNSNELQYKVEIRNKGVKSEVNCRMLRSHGGAYNYEDIIYRGYKATNKTDSSPNYPAVAGDAVVVAFINGNSRDPIILGCLKHAARDVKLKVGDGIQYISEFNGIETRINNNGEFKVTFKGQPTNLSKLSNSPKDKIAPPTYNDSIGTSYYQFDKTGSYEVNDNAKSDKQRIKLDKANGIIYVESGKISLKLIKKTQTTALTCKIMNVDASDKITYKTKEFSLKASKSVKIESPKIAIGKKGIELLDQLSKLIDALGKVKPISPIGPCTPLNTVAEWKKVDMIKRNIKNITGSL